jgi:hypothetical protein
MTEPHRPTRQADDRSSWIVDPRAPVGDASLRHELQALLVLESTEAEAGKSGFAAHVLCRLATWGQIHEDQAQFGLSRLINELSEVTADLGSWGVVSLQALDHEIAVGPGRELIENTLRASILLGALAYKALTLARDHLPQETGGSAP